MHLYPPGFHLQQLLEQTNVQLHLHKRIHQAQQPIFAAPGLFVCASVLIHHPIKSLIQVVMQSWSSERKLVGLRAAENWFTELYCERETGLSLRCTPL